MVRNDENDTPDDEIRIGVSSCLLGAKVRYDGGHKHDRFLTGTLAKMVTFVPVCPEVEVGFGTPRPTLRLQEGEERPRLVFTASGEDVTARMRTFAAGRIKELERLDIRGYILKSKSPSCGMERVKVWRPGKGKGIPVSSSRGIFADELMAHMPHLPVEEDGRLHDPKLRETFFEQVFGYHRLKGLFRPRWRLGDLVRFHSEEKLLLLSHHPEQYRALGRLVARGKGLPREELKEQYSTGFMEALACRSTKGRQINVMQHMAGYFKKQLSPPERTELEDLIKEYRRGLVPLIVPLTLIRHHAHRLSVDYLKAQQYLQPHPGELMLRNHV